MGMTAFGLLLLTPAAPVPALPPLPSVPSADRLAATVLAQQVYQTASNIDRVRPIDMKEMFAGAIRGLYEEAGVAVPDSLVQSARNADSTTELLNVMADARLRLGNTPSLKGPRSYFAAVNGFKHALDPYCGLTSPRVNRVISVDMDFGIGIELDGVSGERWSIYRAERSVDQRMSGRAVKAEQIPSPATFPWRIKRVIPGSPAQRAGVHIGDVITHLNGVEVTSANAGQIFGGFAFPPGAGIDPRSGQPIPVRRTFQLRREGNGKPIEVKLESESYSPETVFGVMRTNTGEWDCMLDRKYKIGYIRLGHVEAEADDRVADMLRDLKRRGCRALILDLRWCPGGYVNEGTAIAGMFLKPNDVIAEVRTGKDPDGIREPVQAYRAAPPPTGGIFLDTPVLVLVGQETTGGGELIAAALQDNGRCKVMGQRTAGRAAIQNAVATGFLDLQFKVTTGTTLRPNGKPRQRNPNSKPTDDWGIRPDPGLEVPVTLDLSKKLHRWADEHSLRPAGSLEALDFDDPAKDPYRSAALEYLRKELDRNDEQGG